MPKQLVKSNADGYKFVDQSINKYKNKKILTFKIMNFVQITQIIVYSFYLFIYFCNRLTALQNLDRIAEKFSPAIIMISYLLFSEDFVRKH